MRENCRFKAKVVVTAENKHLILTVMPELDIVPGDEVDLRYEVNVDYLGDCARKLRAMEALGATGDSTDILIKRVFELFSGSL